eukprot:gnl/TRDRNA2_/TRDRNA2_206067_c0_seq1.p1 gnl/TRDRNA2_/TRDRNA2_206067_c0~~gnl/TRDRNA2_/TRDRNA2_206067_c0_seq1.p1  ORF type:complete len:138 (+),score=14.00 gnl/TRDRNA2_/TRDRNA2_206067_c0_seq1:47-415(+)
MDTARYVVWALCAIAYYLAYTYPLAFGAWRWCPLCEQLAPLEPCSTVDADRVANSTTGVQLLLAGAAFTGTSTLIAALQTGFGLRAYHVDDTAAFAPAALAKDVGPEACCTHCVSSGRLCMR